MSEDEQSYVSPSLIQSSHHVSNYSAQPSNLVKCTIDRCVGNTFKNPHKPDQCFKQPANFAKRDEWMNKQDENKKQFKRRNFNHQQANHSDSGSNIRGVKIVRPPTALANHAMTFLIDFQPVTSQPVITVPTQPIVMVLDLSSAYIQVPVEFPQVQNDNQSNQPSAQGSELVDIDATASSVTPAEGIWALNDTGASHHMFNDLSFFDASTIKPLEDSNKRPRLAGGDASLAVHSTGSVKLRAGDGTIFTLADCLYVPELSRNLIAGGALLKKGVITHINSSNPDCFSLVIGQCALFNGAFSGNLMLVALEPVI